MASLVLYEAITRNYISAEYNEPVLITFGQPRTGNEKFVIDFNSKIKNNFRVVRDGDIVTSIPYSLINNQYRHLGGLILVNKEMTSIELLQISKSLNINYHLYYLNPESDFSNWCR